MSETASLLTNDEGFSSEFSNNEEILPKPFEAFLSENGLDQLTVSTPSVTSTNHRTMLKPSDVKSRSNSSRKQGGAKTANSDLSIVEEHEVSVEGGKIKKITHWTVPYV